MFRRSSRPSFKRNSAARNRLADWWLVWRMPVLLLVVMSVWWFGFRPTSDDQEWTQVSTRFALCGAGSSGGQREIGCVVDGDTVIIGFGAQRRRIRLTGFDTPEIDGACTAESELAESARGRLHQWLNQGAFDWSGGDDPPYDQYSRELREIRRTAQGERPEYLAQTMIEEGLAAENGWGAFPEDWCS